MTSEKGCFPCRPRRVAAGTAGKAGDGLLLGRGHSEKTRVSPRQARRRSKSIRRIPLGLVRGTIWRRTTNPCSVVFALPSVALWELACRTRRQGACVSEVARSRIRQNSGPFAVWQLPRFRPKSGDFAYFSSKRATSKACVPLGLLRGLVARNLRPTDPPTSRCDLWMQSCRPSAGPEFC